MTKQQEDPAFTAVQHNVSLAFDFVLDAMLSDDGDKAMLAIILAQSRLATARQIWAARLKTNKFPPENFDVV